MKYKEQIKTPQWQKRRLDIMQKDNFTCQICGSTEKTLNVHHFVYHEGKMIWDYADWELITLCEECHMQEHNMMDCIIEQIESIKRRGVTMHEIKSLLDTIDISLYLGNDEIIHSIAGDDSGCCKDNDILQLTQRRVLLKKKC